MKRHGWLSAVPMLLALSGCASLQQAERDPDYAPILPESPLPAENNNGAIYQTTNGLALFEDTKARRVGDILTVLLVEQTDAKKSGDTAIDKSNSTSVTNPTILGQSMAINPQKGWPLAAGDWNLGFGLESEHAFEGSYGSKQSNKLSGSITLMVAQVLPNGNLIVQGEKRIGINQGEEFIRLRGIVRQADIRPDNTVYSTQVADAQISYGGTGALADSNRIGWLARFFISPFWAF